MLNGAHYYVSFWHLILFSLFRQCYIFWQYLSSACSLKSVQRKPTGFKLAQRRLINQAIHKCGTRRCQSNMTDINANYFYCVYFRNDFSIYMSLKPHHANVNLTTWFSSGFIHYGFDLKDKDGSTLMMSLIEETRKLQQCLHRQLSPSYKTKYRNILLKWPGMGLS